MQARVWRNLDSAHSSKFLRSLANQTHSESLQELIAAVRLPIAQRWDSILQHLACTSVRCRLVYGRTSTELDLLDVEKPLANQALFRSTLRHFNDQPQQCACPLHIADLPILHYSTCAQVWCGLVNGETSTALDPLNVEKPLANQTHFESLQQPITAVCLPIAQCWSSHLAAFNLNGETSTACVPLHVWAINSHSQRCACHFTVLTFLSCSIPAVQRCSADYLLVKPLQHAFQLMYRDLWLSKRTLRVIWVTSTANHSSAPAHCTALTFTFALWMSVFGQERLQGLWQSKNASRVFR